MEEVVKKLSTSHVKVDEPPPRNKGLRTIPDFLEHFAREVPDQEAVVFASTDGGREAITFKELYENVEKVAQNLIQLGIKRQDVVGINMRTCPEWLYVAFGAIMAGARPCAVSFTYTDGSDLIALMGRLTNCSCLVLDPGFENENWNILSKLLDSHTSDGNVRSQRMPSLKYLIGFYFSKMFTDVKPFEELLKETADVQFPQIDEDDIAFLFQTSGSTGVPKFVAHTHRALLSFTNFESNATLAKEIYFLDRPFGWIGGFPLLLFLGTKRVTISGFCPPAKDIASFQIEVIRQEGCTFVSGLPSNLHKMADIKGDNEDDWPVKLVVVSGQPITKYTVSRLKQLCQFIMIAYVGTEMLPTSINIVAGPESFEDNNCGQVVQGKEVKIVDLAGNTVPVKTTGEIYVRGRELFCEYFNDPEKTSSAFTEDGWYKTDDMGRLLEDGSLIVEGRKSNMIISAGMNVVPEILENAINKCPGVEAVVIVALPDNVKYQVICACVKVVPGSDVDESVIRKFCEEAHGDKLGLFTVLPEYYMFVETFPETNTGKISRAELVTMAKKTFKK